ncbi:MAG: Fe-S protein assembly chaperone HscA [Tepidisphaerales bacterium]
MAEGDLIIGIDLGTTNSLVAYCDERGPRIIPSPDGRHRHVPSVVRLSPTGEPGADVVGHAARATAVKYPTETVYSVKRLMGRGMKDVEKERAYLTYAVVPYGGGAGEAAGGGGAGGMVAVQVGARRVTPQQVSAMVLAELRRWAEAHFGREVRKAVITVPAYFDDAQRQATRDAGAIAGLEVVRIVNEPTAAALAYGLDRVGEGGTIAVYDFGGGTFDISILRIEGGVFRVLSTSGDTHLGGDDIDRAIIRLVQEEIAAQLGSTLEFPPETRQALRDFAERVKMRLSTDESATLEVSLGDGRMYRRTLTRSELESLAEPLVQRTLERCRVALRDAFPGLPPDDAAAKIDRVVMVGGSTYMPLVRKRVQELFGREPYTALNPMEVVALGAAVQGAILAKVNRSLLLQDIIPLSLGIETMGGAVAKLITKGRSIPCMAEELFSTYVDGQTAIKIHVLQGERELARDCRSLAEFVLAGIPPMPAGIPKVKVRFLVDASGVLSVTAKEERSGKQAEIQVVPSYGLTRDEVTRMVRESVLHAREDMLAHRLIDLRNQVTLDTAAIEKSLAIVGDEIDPAYKAELLAKMSRVRELAGGDDANALHAALIDLDKSSARLGELAIAKTLRESEAG